MTGYERLRNIADDDRMQERVHACFTSIRHYGIEAWRAMTLMADDICGKYGLSAEVHRSAVVFYHLGSRAKQPAAIVVSMAGGRPSPSAMVTISTAMSLIQVFEGDADDRDFVEDAGAHAARWVETKGRMLLH